MLRLTLGTVLIALLLPLLLVAATGQQREPPAGGANDKGPAKQQAVDKALVMEAAKLHQEGVDLLRGGKPLNAVVKLGQALEIQRKLYPDGNAETASILNNLGVALEWQGNPAEALKYHEQALAMRQKLYPIGHADLAESLSNMGVALESLGKPAKALPYFEQALAMRRKLYGAERDGHAKLAESLSNMGAINMSLGEPAKALPYFEEALAMFRKLYALPDGHRSLAMTLENMGAAWKALGNPAKALPYFEQALAMNRKLYPKDRNPLGHPELAISLHHMGDVLELLGEPAKALPYLEQALAMKRRFFPPQHPQIAYTLNSLGNVHKALGEPAKALPYYEQALTIVQKLYPPGVAPDGHGELAMALGNMGNVLYALGEKAKAVLYHQKAVAMYRKLYPLGHPNLAHAMNSLGISQFSQGQIDKALSVTTEALAMSRKLYPPKDFADSHPDVAVGLSNVGGLHAMLRQYPKALPFIEEALAINRKLYPTKQFADGHPNLAHALDSMGNVFLQSDEPAKALPCYVESLSIYQRLAAREIASMSEAPALAYLKAQPRARDGYLSVIKLAPPAGAYDPLWHARGNLLPVLQARNSGVLALLEKSPELRKTHESLISVRRQIGRLQNEFPSEKEALQARDQKLADLNDQQDSLERKLAAGLPEFKHLKELAAKGPADLAKALPKDAAFVDLIRYDHADKGKLVASPRYVAFLVLPGQAPKFLDIGDAAPIDDAAFKWREHIHADLPSRAPAELRKLVWDMIARELPATTKRVYICPDGNLARIPFVALPGSKKGTILLEGHAIAIVPSGPWLLGQLLYPPKASDLEDRVLAVGAVDYGGDKKELPFTEGEMKRVLEAFGQPHGDGFSGTAASTDAIRANLPKFRYAHFAIHGYFDEKNLTEERKRQKEYLKNWALLDEPGQRAGTSLRNAAGFTGLLFAGAHAPRKEGKDNGILTALDIVDLPLQKLRLCVLSACETGLGELTEAEGVLGLQRGFHAAGCPNVVGTLWPVDDDATAALMTAFYFELRTNKHPPLEALRLAQLTLYYHKDRIVALAGKRGPVNQAATVKLGVQPPAAPPAATNTAQTQLWAAFVLSGLGD